VLELANRNPSRRKVTKWKKWKTPCFHSVTGENATLISPPELVAVSLQA
jgi:hypothetical protein